MLKNYIWNEEKNKKLKEERGVSFDDVIEAIIELELDNQDLEKMKILANKFDLSIPNLIKDILDQYLKKHLAENR